MKDMHRIMNPANRYEQVTGSIDLICEFCDVPSPINTMDWDDALQYTAYWAIAGNHVAGYHFRVLQRAIKDHNLSSDPSTFLPPYTHEELYDED